jgi:uncharacterized coiled-coil protein SlyX
LLERLRRRRGSTGQRIDALERRVASLEGVIEGLQDAVYRESMRQDERSASLERRTDPKRMARALSEDARRRGL